MSDALHRRSIDAALASDDLHRRVWVLAYTRRPAEAVAAARRLGNKMLLAMAQLSLTRTILAQPADEETRWEALESTWDGAQRCHSFLMVNHAAHLMGAAHLCAGAPVNGLLLLRAPVKDWLWRADIRVWDVLHTIATGLALIGDLTTAARLAGAIGDRRLHFVPEAERRQLRSLLVAGLPAEDCARHERAGRQLDSAGAVAEALQRIDALAAPTAPTEEASLTPRQQEVAQLVARGMTNKQIAQRLRISRFTAETHVRNILAQLGAASRSEIATWATRSGHQVGGAGT